MMKQKDSHKIFAISLAFLLLFSSSGLAMDMHYCKGELKSISFFGTVKSCHLQPELPPCHKTQKEEKEHQNECCENQQMVIEKTNFNATNPQLVSFENLTIEFVCTWVTVFVTSQDITIKAGSLPEYKPPLPKRNIQAHLQTFII
jgi:hypothetical protein